MENINKLPELDFDKFTKLTKAQVDINRIKNIEKDVGKSLELWGLILGRPFGNLMAAIEDRKLDDIEKYVFQVSAVLVEIYGQVSAEKRR